MCVFVFHLLFLLELRILLDGSQHGLQEEDAGLLPLLVVVPLQRLHHGLVVEIHLLLCRHSALLLSRRVPAAP